MASRSGCSTSRGSAFLQHLRAPLRGAEMHAARAEQRRRHGPLNRLRRRVVGDARRDYAGHHAMLDQDREQGVGHPCFVLRRQAADQHQIGHLGEGNLAYQLFGQVVATHQHAVQLRLAQARDDLRCVAHRSSPSPVPGCQPANHSATSPAHLTEPAIPGFSRWLPLGTAEPSITRRNRTGLG